MSVLSVEAPGSTSEFQRIVGSYKGEKAGPSVVCLGGIHGNEASGIFALERVFSVLQSRRPPFRGELVGIAGNLSALSKSLRYVEEDLNRIWIAERVEQVKATEPSPNENAENAEMRELLVALGEVFARTRGEVHFIDLHTSSAFGAPFVLLGDTLRNRKFAFQFPVPVILGLEEQIDGTLLEYVNSLGHVTLGFEAGEHDEETSIDNQEAAIWVALMAAGNLDSDVVPEAMEARARLAESVDHLPRVLEIRYRHAVDPDDNFRMKNGYRNFQKIRAREHLATDQQGDVLAKHDGRILLPLYQGLGNDGFFIGRDIKPFWLKVSSVLRHFRADRLVPWLPGIRRHPHQSHTFIVNRHVARWLVLQIFHLLGFRKKRLTEDKLIVSRRMYDLRGPHC